MVEDLQKGPFRSEIPRSGGWAKRCGQAAKAVGADVQTPRKGIVFSW